MSTDTGTENKSEKTTVFLTVAQRSWLEAEAARQQRTPSWIMRGLIESARAGLVPMVRHGAEASRPR